mmetsp:Transcript_129273/g.235149  ORF Transcript_129273/g.235149 Transcript_129273/m.235149 type:complete len:217 (-) Transcript_129273:319-969(-)
MVEVDLLVETEISQSSGPILCRCCTLVKIDESAFLKHLQHERSVVIIHLRQVHDFHQPFHVDAREHVLHLPEIVRFSFDSVNVKSGFRLLSSFEVLVVENDVLFSSLHIMLNLFRVSNQSKQDVACCQSEAVLVCNVILCKLNVRVKVQSELPGARIPTQLVEVFIKKTTHCLMQNTGHVNDVIVEAVHVLRVKRLIHVVEVVSKNRVRTFGLSIC